MRISAAGKPGLFACDAAEGQQSKGVCTGHPEFPHFCRRCSPEPIRNPPVLPVLRTPAQVAA
jgi:hypothetical protein